MPTVDAANHARTFGSTGAYDKQASTVADATDAGIEVFDAEDRPIEGLIDVLDLIAEHRAILSTCHLSVREIELLVTAARERGVEKIMITHPFFKVPNLDLDRTAAAGRAGRLRRVRLLHGVADVEPRPADPGGRGDRGDRRPSGAS